jgi:integrase
MTWRRLMRFVSLLHFSADLHQKRGRAQITLKVTELVLAGPATKSREGEPYALTPAQARLRELVLDSVPSVHSKRNYAKALDDLFAFCASRPLSRALLMEWRVAMESLSPSTINVRLSAVRKMIGEARRNGMIGQEEAASLTDIPNIRQKGTRLENWLTREQAKELLAVPDRSTLKGKRDYVILSLLVGCALRRNELAELDVQTIQQRVGRWVLADLEGKGRRVRTVAIPIWAKAGNQCLDDCRRHRRWPFATIHLQGWQGRRHLERLGRLVGS